MLTINRPIALATRSGITTLSSAFDERLRANYSLMTAEFTAKELLHLLVNAPEGPVMGDSLTTIAVDHRVENRQSILLDVVNNVVNRILLSDNTALTYQDRVYVDMALRKFGIENTSVFMRQAKQMREESLRVFREQQTRESHKETEKTTREHYIEGEKGEGLREAAVSPDAKAASDRLYLHERIYSRLQTAAIYRLMRHFTKARADFETVLDRQELLVSEQSRVARWITAGESHTHTDVWNEAQLTYLETQRETQAHTSERIREGGLMEQAAAAALLQTVNNVLNVRTAHYAKDENFWADVTHSVEHTAKNSLSRLLMQYEEENSSTAVTNFDITKASEASYYNAFPVTLTDRHEESVLKEMLPAQVPETQSERGQTDTASFLETRRERITQTQDAAPIAPQESVHTSENLIHTEREAETHVSESKMIEALTEIDRQNRERVEKIIESAGATPPPAKLGVPDRKRIMSDALRALESPEQVIAEAAERAETIHKPAAELERILTHADSSTRYIVEQLQLLERDPKAAEQMGVRRVADPSELSHEINRIEREKTELIQRIYGSEAAAHEATTAPAAKAGRADGPQLGKGAAPGGATYDYAALPFVHRTVEKQNFDELLEQVQHRKTQQHVQSETHVVNEQNRIEQTQVNEVTRELVNKTAEDVTELVNKTLMRQIGTISDKVYTQLEKRLQNEKARRGRF